MLPAAGRAGGGGGGKGGGAFGWRERVPDGFLKIGDGGGRRTDDGPGERDGLEGVARMKGEEVVHADPTALGLDVVGQGTEADPAQFVGELVAIGRIREDGKAVVTEGTESPGADVDRSPVLCGNLEVEIVLAGGAWGEHEHQGAGGGAVGQFVLDFKNAAMAVETGAVELDDELAPWVGSDAFEREFHRGFALFDEQVGKGNGDPQI